MADEGQNLPKIRTLKTDAEIYLRDNKVSELEVRSKTYSTQTAVRMSEKLAALNFKKLIYIGSVVLVLGALGGAIYFFYPAFMPKRDVPALPKPAPPKFVEAEAEADLVYGASGLTEAIKGALAQPFRYGSISYLKIKGSDGYIAAGEFISAMGWKAPEAFANTLEPDFNALIVYQPPARADGPPNAPVFIFKSKSFPQTFAAILNWEASMWQDLRPFIDLGGVDTATLHQQQFTDDTLKNNDARAFRSGGQTLLEYAFFNKKYIIISPSRDALELVLSRLIALPPQ